MTLINWEISLEENDEDNTNNKTKSCKQLRWKEILKDLIDIILVAYLSTALPWVTKINLSYLNISMTLIQNLL